MESRRGAVRLPPGFRFHPTDEELLVQYLKRKVFSSSFSISFIPQVDLCKSDPWDLPGDLSQERYFFSRKEAKYPNGNRSNRATNSGYWKATGLDKHIVAAKGMKKTLVFYTGKPPHGSRTDWIMHEYRLLPTTTTDTNTNNNWVLCRIFFKRRGGASKEKEESSRSRAANNSSKVVFYNFLAQNNNRGGGASSSSAATSGITTEVSNNNDQQEQEEEESSSCTNTRKLLLP